MKKYFLLLTLFINFGALSQTASSFESLLDCQSEQNGISATVLESDGIVVASISHYYSTALLMCPMNTTNRFEKGNSFTCAGVWEYDFERVEGENGEADAVTVDTVVVLKATKTDEVWSVKYTTAKTYGEKEVTLSCNDIYIQPMLPITEDK